MLIGVDAAVLEEKNNKMETGNFILSFKLLQALGQIDHKNQYILYSYNPISNKMLSVFGTNFQNRVVKPKKYWMQLSLSRELILNPVDIFLGLNQALPLYIKCKCVVLCLDLAFEKFPEYFNNAPKLSWQTKMAVKKANKVISISKSTLKDLEDLYNLDAKKTKVINLSSGSCQRSPCQKIFCGQKILDKARVVTRAKL